MKKILQAINEVMQEVGYVQKDKKNKFHNYNYAGEGSLLQTLRPAIVKAGLILIPSMDEVSQVDDYGNTTVKMSYTLAHKDGEVWPDKISAFGCGNDKNSKGGVGDKGLYKGLTGANKYFLFKLFQIETGDDPEKDTGDDPEKKNGTNKKGKAPDKKLQPITEAQQRGFINWLKDNNIPNFMALEAMKSHSIAKSANIPASLLEQLKDEIVGIALQGEGHE